MPVTISGSGTITGIATGGLPDGSIAAGDLASSLDLTGKTVTLPSGTGGKILQVVQTFKTDRSSSNSTTLTDLPGMSRSITPVAAGSSFLVISDLSLSQNSQSSTMWINLWRDSTEIAQPAAGTAPATLSHYVQGAISSVNRSFTFLDTPTYTLGNSLTYKWRWQTDNSSLTVYINRHSGNENYSSVSQITVMEVAA